MKTLFVFLFAIFSLSCASSASGKKENSSIDIYKLNANGYWRTMPSNNSITVIGVSNPLSKKSDEIAAAKEDAARKIAMYHGIYISIESIHTTGSSFFDYVNDSKIEVLYDSNYKKYIEQLIFDPQRDVTLTDKGVFVRFKYITTTKAVKAIIDTKNIKDRPNWTHSRNLPKIDGYSTAVGFAQNQMRIKDTIMKATEAGAARIIENNNTQIADTSKSVVDFAASNTIHAKSKGKLSNFQVINLWIDPKTDYVYTLVIAKFDN